MTTPTTTAPKSRLVRARVTRTLADHFALAAAADGRTMSDALRVAISAYIDHVAARNDDDPEPGEAIRVVETPSEEAPSAVAS